MARPLRIEYPNAFYHVTVRGNEGKKIFNSSKDKEKLINYIHDAHQRFKIVIHAYCLMDNHYHLLIETPHANLSKAMQFINSSYTTFFNIKYKRIGHLLQGRYKAFVIDKDLYATEVSRYIHLNPIRAGIVTTLEGYKLSSYKYYLFSFPKPEFLCIDFILSFFSKKESQARVAYRNFIEDELEEKVINPFKKIKAGIILGENEFVENIKEKYIDMKKEVRDLPSLRILKENYILPKKIIEVANKVDSLSPKEREKIIIYLLRRYSSYTLNEISKEFFKEKNVSAISETYRRLDRKRKNDRSVDKKLKIIENRLLNVEV